MKSKIIGLLIAPVLVLGMSLFMATPAFAIVGPTITPIPTGIGAGDLRSIAVAPDGTSYVAAYGIQDIYKIAPSGTVTDFGSTGVSIYATIRLAISPNGNTLYWVNGATADNDGNIYTRNTASMANGSIATSPSLPGMRALAVASGGTIYAVAYGDSYVHAINAGTGIGTNLNNIAANYRPSLALSPDGNTLYMGDSDGNIWPINTTTGVRGAAINTGGGTYSVTGLAISLGGYSLYVGTNINGNILTASTLGWSWGPSIATGMSTNANGIKLGVASTSGAIYAITDGDANVYKITNSLTFTSAAPPTQWDQNLLFTPYTVTATGGMGVLQFTATGLPAGLTLGLTSGTISGTPTTVANYAACVITVTDTVLGTATQAAPMNIVLKPHITSAPPPSAWDKDILFTPYTVTATDGTGALHFSLTGAPAGLVIGWDSGIINGTPTTVFNYSTCYITVIDDIGGSSTQAAPMNIVPQPSVTTVSLPDGEITAPYPIPPTNSTLTGTNGVGAYTWSIVGTLPAGLTLAPATGAITGIPSIPAGTTVFIAVVTDSIGGTGTKILGIHIIPNPSITTLSLAGGEVTVPYNQTVTALGGTPWTGLVYSWSISAGGLPPGLSLNGGTGNISGTPSAGDNGTYNFTVRVADSVGGWNTQALSIFIQPAPAITSGAPPAQWDITLAAFTPAFSVTANLGTPAYTFHASGLPTGLGINPTTGLVSGIPTTLGPFSGVFWVTDSIGGFSANQPFTITINPMPVITTASPLQAWDITLAGYNQTIVATPGTLAWPGNPWSNPGGGLPPGLTLHTDTGAITGTPITLGVYNFNIMVTDAVGGTNTKSFQITINPLPAITTGSTLPQWDATLTGYSQTLTYTPGTLPWPTNRWSLVAGALPGGVTLDTAAGIISGTPAAAGVYGFTIRLTDGVGGTFDQVFSFTVNPLPVITTGATLPQWDATLPGYTQTLTFTPGTLPWPTNRWSLVGGFLPGGVTLDTATGVIAGTPATSGTYFFIVRLTDAVGGTGDKTFTLVINPLPSITSVALPSPWDVGYAYVRTLTANPGTGALTFTVTGTLPTGITFNGTNVISGTPTVVGLYTGTITVTDSIGGTGTQAFSINIVPLPIITSSPPMPSGEKTVPYNQSLTETGGVGPYVWSIIGGTLPPGLTLNTANGAITGTPTTSGIFLFQARVVDSFGASSSSIAVPLTAVGPLSITIGPYITTASLPNANIGVLYSQPLTVVAGTAPYTWSIISGLLPPGLTLNPTTGVITGYVGNYGTYVFTVRVIDSLGSPYSPQTDQRTFSITVNGALLTVNIPNGGESWAIGSTQTITWTSAGLPVQSLVNIQISRDGGLTWTYIYYAIFNNPNSSNSMTWTVTGPAGTNNLIRISAFYNGYIYNVSNATFTINTAFFD